MSDIDPLAGVGIFGLVWLLSIVYWKTTALILAATAALVFRWRSFRFRIQALALSLILLVAHLADSVYFIFILH